MLLLINVYRLIDELVILLSKYTLALLIVLLVITISGYNHEFFSFFVKETTVLLFGNGVVKEDCELQPKRTENSTTND